MKKFISIFLSFVIFTMSCSSCSCTKEDNLVVYRNFYSQDVTTFNYLVTNEYNNVIRIANLIDGLVENDKYGNIVPSIAKSWKSEIVDGKQIWTFYLKDNVYWSDYNGEKYALVTANDFVTTFKYSFNYNIKSDNFKFAAGLIENGMNYYYGTLINNFDYNDVVNKINDFSSFQNSAEYLYYSNIKEIFDKCNSQISCITDFDNVGVKAINDYELQFILQKPCSYFLSSLTYYSFLPVSEKFIQEVGINNFGTSKKTLLYNGAYLLENYSHTSKIEFIKNPNYWDKDNVFIDKLVFTKTLNYSSHGYARLSYESGNLDEFILTEDDTVGWKKYVIGDDNIGSNTNPVGNNTYVIPYTSDFTTYYFLFNQNRTNYKYSTLAKEEIEIANKALQNDNFRKSLFHGIYRDYYFNSEINNTLLSSIVPPNFINFNNVDYSNYLINIFATNNGISVSEATSLYNDNWIYNLDKSKHYLELALEELNFFSSDLPIKLEYTYYKDNDYIIYDKARLNIWNRLLNGCSINQDDDCQFKNIEIVYNDSIKTSYDYDIAFNSKEFSISLLGLYPDFNDPTAYLQAFSHDGELYNFLNHNYSEEIDAMLTEIDNFYLDEHIDKRFQECAKLEYYILFEKNLVLPLSMNGFKNQIIVSNLVPFQKMTANYGLSSFKFKKRKIREKNYTQADIASLKEDYYKGSK